MFFHHAPMALGGDAARSDGRVTWTGLVAYVQGNVNGAACDWFPDRAAAAPRRLLQTPHRVGSMQASVVLVKPVAAGPEEDVTPKAKEKPPNAAGREGGRCSPRRPESESGLPFSLRRFTGGRRRRHG